MTKLTYEAALKQQKEAKDAVKTAKQAQTDYFNDNKLKKNQDYTKDKKHGKKVISLSKEVKKAMATLENINTKVDSFEKDKKDSKKGKEKEKKAKSGSAAGARTKYEYPPDVTSSSDKKKYRQMMRSGKTPTTKKEKSKKEEVAETQVAKKSKEKSSKEKGKAKKAKSSDD